MQLDNFIVDLIEIINTGKNGMESAEEVSPRVIDWLDRNMEKDDWYLHVNYWDPHTPYRTPESYENPFANDPLPEWLTDEVFEEQLKTKVGPHGPREINMFNDNEDEYFPKHPGSLSTMEDLRQMIDGYDTGIKYVDDQLGVVFQKLKEAGIWEETAIIISADHGENMGELGIYGEHGTADQITTRVPFIVKWPGAQKIKLNMVCTTTWTWHLLFMNYSIWKVLFLRIGMARALHPQF